MAKSIQNGATADFKKVWHAPCPINLVWLSNSRGQYRLRERRPWKMGAEMVLKRLTWPAELTLTLIGGKWKGLILHQLLRGESKRFGELKRLLPGISAKMLTKYLKELEFDGLITRLETQGLHPRILYTPTQRSRSLSPILAAILQWGEQHLEVYGTRREVGITNEGIEVKVEVEMATVINAQEPWEVNLSQSVVSQSLPKVLPD